MIKLTPAIWEIVERMQADPKNLAIVVNEYGKPDLLGRELQWHIVNDMVDSPNAVLHYNQQMSGYILTEYGKTVKPDSSKSHIIAANLYVGVGSEGRERKARLDKLFERWGGGSAVIRGLLDGTLDIIKRK